MNRTRGFTLTQLLAVVAIIGILVVIAMPAYNNYVQRAKIHDAFNNLLVLNAQMQQYWTDHHSYGATGCGVTMPSDTAYFHFLCNISNSQQAYLITAKGLGTLLNYNFTIDNNGNRVTIDFPGVSGLPYSCWIDKAGPC